jgi:glucose-1-phosphate cytidylyltransferase
MGLMKAVILAGGRGTRLAEETGIRPKPMVEIGGWPIIRHIMQIYSSHGIVDFVVACGYRGEIIKEYFHNFQIHSSDWKIDMGGGRRTPFNTRAPEWNVTLVDTGQDTMTGGRLLRLREVLEGQRFMVTYGDGVGNVDITSLMKFHEAHGRAATVTAVRPPARFGGLEIEDDRVAQFSEKPQTDAGWINGGFFVFEPSVLDYITGPQTILERDPLERLASDGELMAYRHEGFWQPMDTLRDRELLESLWASGNAPWKSWE